MANRPDELQSQVSKDPRKRRATAVKGVVFISLAAFAAVAVAVLLTRYMDARVSAARIPTAKIVVAKVDIPVAAPIQPDWLEVVDWPLTARPTGSISDPSVVANQVAFTPISKGEAVLSAKLVKADARAGLATLLPEGMRALSVRVDDVIGVSGFINPGDHVDVIVTIKPKEDGPFISKIVLQDIKVLAVGRTLQHKTKEADKATPVTVATLQVDSDQSERLALASDKGRILLALRGIGDEGFAETGGITPPKLIATDATPSEQIASAPVPERPKASRTRRDVAHRVAAAPPAPAPASTKQVVEILRGDMFEKRAFEEEKRQ